MTTFVSLFAGVDGLGHAWEQIGYECTLQVEWDPNCRIILDRHFPHVPKMGDIADVHASDLLRRGRPDVVVVTFPCTDTSIGAPARAGLAGSRSGQFFQAVRVLYELGDDRPPWVLIENPDGILKSNGGADFDTVLRLMADLGYVCSWRVVDAQYLGTPQRRRRVLMVCHLGDDTGPSERVLGGQAHGEGQAAAPHPKRSGPWPAGSVPALPDGIGRVWRKSARPTKSLAKGGYETWVWDGLANTLTGFDWGNAARQVHWVGHTDGRLRGFTLLEHERLQGLPDHWTAGIPEGDLRRKRVLIKAGRGTILGNMLHVGTADWVGRRLWDEIHTHQGVSA